MMRLRLQMLTPAAAKCNWKRRISSVVAVLGERWRNAANRLQLRMWPLCVPAELPSIHVLDHAVTQRGDGIRTHRKLLPWMRLTTPRSSRQEAPPPIDDLYPGCRARRLVSLSVSYRGAI